MADNVTITAGSGTTVGTDERTINSVAVQVQRVDEQGGTAIASAQATPTTSAATLIAARDTRKYVTILSKATTNVYIGPATVTSANGFLLEPGASLTVYTTALIQVIGATGVSGTVYTFEVYDS